MGLLAWIVFGLAAGAVARLVTPGRSELGFLGTLVVGLVGAVLGGVLGEILFDQDVRFAFELGPFLLSVAGAVALLLALRMLEGTRR